VYCLCISLGSANDTQLHRHAGQYGHSIHVQDNTLYVYGGTQGSLTYDVISIGLGDIISQVSVLPLLVHLWI